MSPRSGHSVPSLLLRWALILFAVLLGSTLLSTLLVLRCGSEPETPASVRSPTDSTPSDSAPADTGARVKAEMRRVAYHVDPDIVLEIGYLKGDFIPTKPGAIPVFDDPNSFDIHVASAQIAIDTVSLSRLLNRYVFNYRGAPIRDLRISIEGDRLVQRGKLGNVSFTMRAEVSATPDGRIRLHPTNVKVLGLSVDGLMRRLGMTLEKTFHVGQNHGLEVDKNDLLLDPAAIVPPPRIQGEVTAVRLEAGRLVQQFGRPDSLAPKSYFGGKAPAPNFMHYHGATLRFGRLTMHPTDMLIVDQDPSDPLDFSVQRYHEQLVAGSHRTTPEDGLVVVMPDLSRLGPSQATGAANNGEGRKEKEEGTKEKEGGKP